MIPLMLFSVINLALALNLLSVFYAFLQGLKGKSQLKNKDLLNFIKNVHSASEAEWKRKYDLFILPYENRMYWLQANAGISTLLGLFGTVLGIYSSFSGMKQAGKVSLEILAGGISEAILTTIFGLFIAIPSLLVFHYLKTRLDEIDIMVEDAIHESKKKI